MKQLILNALKTKYQGVSESILDRIAEKLAKTVTSADQVQTAVDGVTFQQVLESYGDSRATQAQQTAVHNSEQKYGLKDAGTLETKNQRQKKVSIQPSAQQNGGAGANEIPAWAKAIIDTNKTIVDRMNKLDEDRITATRRQQIDKLVENLPENLKKAYGRTPVDSLTDEQFTALVGEITAEVSDISTTITQKGAVFGQPSNNGGTVNNTQLTEDQVKAISARQGTAGADQQPL